jgi:hypothetical protein
VLLASDPGAPPGTAGFRIDADVVEITIPRPAGAITLTWRREPSGWRLVSAG